MLPNVSPYKEALAQFFLISQIWVFLGIIMAFAIPAFELLGTVSGWAYLNIVVGLSLFFAPVLVFVSTRERLKKNLAGWAYKLVWAAFFVAYPIVSYAFNLTLNTFLIPGFSLPAGNFFNEDIFHLLGWTFAAADLLLHGPLTKRWLPNLGRWFEKLTFKAVASVLLVGVSILMVIADDAVFEKISNSEPLLGFALFAWSVFQIGLMLGPFLGLFYFHQHFLYRKLYPRRGLLYYFAGAVGAVLVFGPIQSAIAQFLPLVREHVLYPSGAAHSIFHETTYGAPLLFMLGSVPVILYLEWAQKTRTISALKREQAETELNLLKQQVNPHFFFNTLNNLYALSLQSAPETPDTVLRLSGLMRYVIYRAKEERVSLHEEITYLRDYLDLQRIRVQEEAEIDFIVNVQNGALQVPPMLFIILLENAFKHGIEQATGESYLQLEIKEQDGEVSVTCRNSVEGTARDQRRPPGIGLENLTRRLELLYPESHTLKTSRSDKEYRVDLVFWQAVTLQELEMSLELSPVPGAEQNYV